MDQMICISSSHMSQASETLFSLQLGHAYNNIFSLRLGRDKVVFITGYKMVKEALVTQAENFVDRPYSPLLARVYSGNGRLNVCDLSQELGKSIVDCETGQLFTFKTDYFARTLLQKNEKRKQAFIKIVKPKKLHHLDPFCSHFFLPNCSKLYHSTLLLRLLKHFS